MLGGSATIPGTKLGSAKSCGSVLRSSTVKQSEPEMKMNVLCSSFLKLCPPPNKFYSGQGLSFCGSGPGGAYAIVHTGHHIN